MDPLILTRRPRGETFVSFKHKGADVVYPIGLSNRSLRQFEINYYGIFKEWPDLNAIFKGAFSPALFNMIFFALAKGEQDMPTAEELDDLIEGDEGHFLDNWQNIRGAFCIHTQDMDTFKNLAGAPKVKEAPGAKTKAGKALTKAASKSSKSAPRSTASAT